MVTYLSLNQKFTNGATLFEDVVQDMNISRIRNLEQFTDFLKRNKIRATTKATADAWFYVRHARMQQEQERMM